MQEVASEDASFRGGARRPIYIHGRETTLGGKAGKMSLKRRFWAVIAVSCAAAWGAAGVVWYLNVRREVAPPRVLPVVSDSQEERIFQTAVPPRIMHPSGFMKAVAPGGDASALTPAAAKGGGKERTVKDPFASLPPHHWLARALGELGASPDGAGGVELKPVAGMTRYEAAVLFTRMMERMKRELASKNLRQRRRVVELVERIRKELAGELEMLGVRQAGLERRVEELEKNGGRLNRDIERCRTRIGRLAGKVSRLEGSAVPSLTRRVERLEKRTDGLAAEDADVGRELERQRKALDTLKNIVSRLMVRSAVHEARLMKMNRAERSGGGSASAIARRLGEMGERLAALERMVRGNDTRIASLVSQVDGIRMDMMEADYGRKLERKIGCLAQMVDLMRKRMENLPRSGSTKVAGGLDEEALDEIKGMLTSFLVQFEKRLCAVERSLRRTSALRADG